MFAQYTYFPNKDITKAIRLDNLEINESSIKKVVRNRDEGFTLMDAKVYESIGKDFVMTDPDLKQIYGV